MEVINNSLIMYTELEGLEGLIFQLRPARTVKAAAAYTLIASSALLNAVGYLETFVLYVQSVRSK